MLTMTTATDTETRHNFQSARIVIVNDVGAYIRSLFY